MYLAGLGLAFSDLPRRGINLRLYTYDPPGSQFYSSAGYIYNTGHYDASLATGPCSAVDAQGFNDWGSMDNYANARGEMLVIVSRPDLNALCAYRSPTAQTIVPATLVPGGPYTPGGVYFTPPQSVDTGSTTIVLRGGATSSTSQPSTPGVFTAPSPSQVLDTGQSSEAQAFQDWLQTHPGGSFADFTEYIKSKLAGGVDNTMLVYAAVGLGVLLLAGRRRAA